MLPIPVARNFGLNDIIASFSHVGFRRQVTGPTGYPSAVGKNYLFFPFFYGLFLTIPPALFSSLETLHGIMEPLFKLNLNVTS